ncbi:MAG TPA: hypothetical protein VJC03_00765, partial [bacterium]|nr:hypothetical protein [bacterium]
MLLFCLFPVFLGAADNWTHYTGNYTVEALVFEGGYVWCAGRNHGVIRCKISDKSVVRYTVKDGLPTNDVIAACADGDGNKWFGFFNEGVARFDGAVWKIYTDDDGLGHFMPNNNGLFFDGTDLWACTPGGLSKYLVAGDSWTTYDTLNSDIIQDDVRCIAKDGSGNKWIGTAAGVSKFDGVNWTDYDKSGSGIHTDTVYGIAVDGNGAVWFAGTGGALSKFDGASWSTYSAAGSFNHVYSLVIDSEGNKWLATDLGG